MVFRCFRCLSTLIAGLQVAICIIGSPHVFAMQQQAQCVSAASEELPTGMTITPTTAKGACLLSLNPGLPEFPDFTVDHPVSTAISPDGKILLILTSGYNFDEDEPLKTGEYVFVYNIELPQPELKQVLRIPNSFVGIAWNPRYPEISEFYVSGGGDDIIHVFRAYDNEWQESLPGIDLHHGKGLGRKVDPVIAGLAVNKDGTRLLAANLENDSVSLVDLTTKKKIAELDLRPGKNNPRDRGKPGGEYPYGVVIKDNDKAYISSLRDREIVVVNLRHNSLVVASRINRNRGLQGQPNKLILNKMQTLLFAAADNSDSVIVIDTIKDRVLATIKTTDAPGFSQHQRFKGSSPNSLALYEAPNDEVLYVTNGGTNSVAVIRLDPDDVGKSQLQGMIPTGWYPTAISVKGDGGTLYIVNGKSIPGANARTCQKKGCQPGVRYQEYVWQLEKGGFLVIPRPDGSELARLTAQVAHNNHFSDPSRSSDPMLLFLRQRIKHVIYVIKENRTYDQVLGDLEKGDGDPTLTLFKEPMTPNHHALARQFVTLDNFLASGEVSGNGWNWSTAARDTDFVEKTIPSNFPPTVSKRSFPYDYEGSNRGINVGQAEEKRDKADLDDPDDQLPGTADVDAPDGPDGIQGEGYLWDSALRAHLSVRNYGFFLGFIPSDAPQPQCNTVCTSSMVPANPSLQKITDVCFRGYDQKYPDYWRFKEWEREFDDYVRHDNLPKLELVRLPHDHFGDFKNAICDVNTVETQMADNDYALGLLVEKIAGSRYKKDTLIFVVEDDAQSGPDHVDAHRSLAFVVGPYVKQKEVIKNRFTTVSILRTIEEVLGIKPLGINDEVQQPMTEIFSEQQAEWSYIAKIPHILCTTQLPLAHLPQCTSSTGSIRPPHDAQYWVGQTEGLDFSDADKVDSTRFNLILWRGLTDETKPYPSERSGVDLRLNRQKLLEEFK